MAAELIAQRRHRFHGRGVLLPGREPANSDAAITGIGTR
jgi:hypothetical protein